LLDALDQRNASLAKMEREAEPEVKAAVRQVAKLFAAARATAMDTQAPQAERLQAVRVLGRGPDHRPEDLALLVRLLVPQTPEELQAGVITSLGHLREGIVPELLLRGWKGYGPALRSQILDLLLGREERL
jgi:hypothetical protein